MSNPKIDSGNEFPAILSLFPILFASMWCGLRLMRLVHFTLGAYLSFAPWTVRSQHIVVHAIHRTGIEFSHEPGVTHTWSTVPLPFILGTVVWAITCAATFAILLFLAIWLTRLLHLPIHRFLSSYASGVLDGMMDIPFVARLRTKYNSSRNA